MIDNNIINTNIHIFCTCYFGEEYYNIIHNYHKLFLFKEHNRHDIVKVKFPH